MNAEAKELLSQIEEARDKTQIPTMRILAFVCREGIHRSMVNFDYRSAIENAELLLETLKLLNDFQEDS